MSVLLPVHNAQRHIRDYIGLRIDSGVDLVWGGVRGVNMTSNATLVTFSIHLMTSLIGFHNAVLWMVEVARRM
jgi:hypothetical protein